MRPNSGSQSSLIVISLPKWSQIRTSSCIMIMELSSNWAVIGIFMLLWTAINLCNMGVHVSERLSIPKTGTLITVLDMISMQKSKKIWLCTTELLLLMIDLLLDCWLPLGLHIISLSRIIYSLAIESMIKQTLRLDYRMMALEKISLIGRIGKDTSISSK